MIEKITARFAELFGTEPQVFRSPGRVNILGEHTDYNNGFVLPAAIDKAIYIAIAIRADDQIHLYAEDFVEGFETSLADLQPNSKGWTNYILGVAAQLQKRGYAIGGFDLVIDGDVPLGAGLSSSAAVECATVFALNDLFDLGIEKMEMAQIAQKAEHEFAGVMCGIMDQFASMFGEKNQVVRLDCRSLAYEYLPLSLDGIRIVLLNTNVKHNLASTEYNTRRIECERGVSLIQQQYPAVESLRDATLAMVEEIIKPVDETVYRRCKFIVEENERVLAASTDLKKGDLASLGEKMFETHDGLSKEYEVSCKEADYLVDFVRDNPSVLGARMMGGGFGGCTINLVMEEAIPDLIKEVSAAYEAQTGLKLSAYIANIEAGTSKLS